MAKKKKDRKRGVSSCPWPKTFIMSLFIRFPIRGPFLESPGNISGP